MELIPSVRIEIGDTDQDKGMLPGRRQFYDVEIAYAAETENVTELLEPSQQDVGRTSAKLLELASVAWASQPLETELGPASEVNNASVLLARQATKLRAIWGYGNTEREADSKTRAVPSYVGVGIYPSIPGIN